MDCIDEEFPNVFPGVLDPRRLPPPHEGTGTGVERANINEHFNIRKILVFSGDAHGYGSPVINTLEDMLKERYS